MDSKNIILIVKTILKIITILPMIISEIKKAIEEAKNG
jgi:hypothetical protein